MDAKIKKLDNDDNYQLVIHSEFTNIEEEKIDGPKLMAMLGKEELVGTTVGDVLDQLEQAEVGHEVTVKMRERQVG